MSRSTGGHAQLGNAERKVISIFGAASINRFDADISAEVCVTTHLLSLAGPIKTSGAVRQGSTLLTFAEIPGLFPT